MKTNKKVRFLAALITLCMLLSLVPTQFASAAGDVTIIATPNQKEIELGKAGDTAKVVYTISINPNGTKGVSTLEIYASTPEGMTFATNPTKEKGGSGYWSNKAELQWDEVDAPNNPFDYFKGWNYKDKHDKEHQGWFAAATGLDLYVPADKETVLMTIEATIDISKERTYELILGDGMEGTGDKMVIGDPAGNPIKGVTSVGKVTVKKGAATNPGTPTDPGTPTTAKEFKVTFDSKGGSEVKAVTVKEGGKITKPADPKKKGVIFAGWYKDKDLKTKWDFAKDTVTADTVLYVKWDKWGDNSAVMAWMMLVLVSAAGVGVVLYNKKRSAQK